MNIHEQIAVMQAFADGKEIEFNWGGGWQLCPKPAWDWSKLNYRIKPERTITITFTEKELERLRRNWAFFRQDDELNGAIYKKLCNSS